MCSHVRLTNDETEYTQYVLTVLTAALLPRSEM